jgi:hypothetical protein
VERRIGVKHWKGECYLENQTIQVEAGQVYIHDYSYYNPKFRDSLGDSKIKKNLDEWYSSAQKEICTTINKFVSYQENFAQIPRDSTNETTPFWDNGWIPPFDGISIYGFLAIKNPRFYVEVGSGNSTKFAALAIQDHNLRTKIISIDPSPRVEIDCLCTKIYRIPFENMSLDFFNTLTSEDILLIDSSHRSFPNSDVTVFFTEVLPNLPQGILFALHEIFLPHDYPENWSRVEKLWFNEQYLLCTYLLGGANGDRVVCPNAYLSSKPEFMSICEPLWKNKLLDGLDFDGCFFWMQKA